MEQAPLTFNPTLPEQIQTDHVLLNVPFTSQAPLGNWTDPRQEDGCEEASILMAWLWSQDKAIAPTAAEKAIINLSDFETAHYGNYNDLDAQDTARLMPEYYHYNASKIIVKENVSVDDIKNELRRGRLVLVPVNGQRLNNPNFKQPGPTTHMVVVRGFDDVQSQFITNDPGTRNGNLYPYTYFTLLGAMVNYPSGNHLSQVGRLNAMISIQR